jgi:hypothetical protein
MPVGAPRHSGATTPSVEYGDRLFLKSSSLAARGETKRAHCWAGCKAEEGSVIQGIVLLVRSRI